MDYNLILQFSSSSASDAWLVKLVQKCTSHFFHLLDHIQSISFRFAKVHYYHHHYHDEQNTRNTEHIRSWLSVLHSWTRNEVSENGWEDDEEELPFPGNGWPCAGNSFETCVRFGQVAVARWRVDGIAVALLVPELGLSVGIRDVSRDLDARAVEATRPHETTEVLLECSGVRSGKVKLKWEKERSQVLFQSLSGVDVINKF